MAAQESGQLWNDESLGQCTRHIYAKPAFRRHASLHNGRLSFIQFHQDVRAALIEGGPIGGGAHAPRRALEQPYPKMILEPLHQVAHGRLG
jgi:hypothetical protein